MVHVTVKSFHGITNVLMYGMLDSQKLAVCSRVLNPSSSLAVQHFPNSVNIIVPSITHPEILPFKEWAYITRLVPCGGSFPYICSATLYIYVLGTLLTLPCFLCRSLAVWLLPLLLSSLPAANFHGWEGLHCVRCSRDGGKEAELLRLLLELHPAQMPPLPERVLWDLSGNSSFPAWSRWWCGEVPHLQ